MQFRKEQQRPETRLSAAKKGRDLRVLAIRAQSVSGSLRARSPVRFDRLRGTELSGGAGDTVASQSLRISDYGTRLRFLGEKKLNCPFCSQRAAEVVLVSELCYVRWDMYPVTEGHLLIVPKRHIADYFSTTAEERHSFGRWLIREKLYWINVSNQTAITWAST